MTEFNPEEIISKLFSQVRQELNLGVGEYFAALKILKGGWKVKDENDLKELLQLLWCHSQEEQAEFQIRWEEAVIVEKTIKKPSPSSEEIASPHPGFELEIPSTANEPPPLMVIPEPVKRLSPIPVQPPPFKPAQSQSATPFQTYYPVTRRTMAYNWRYLRRMVADGAEENLNVTATVERTANQGFFLSPVKEREKRNHAHLLLMIDQNGSMTPFHHLIRDLVETAKYESNLNPERVEVAYFHNIPSEYVYQDVYLTQPQPLVEILQNCDNDSSILIVSDAGAARGYRRLLRIRETTRVLHLIKRYSSAVAWLNPMPPERWKGSSAQVLKYLIPMFPFDEEGLGQAIDVLRGQALQEPVI